MIYAVGTGRCGTKTIAHVLNGSHEPKPRIIQEANEYHLGDWQSLDALKQKLNVRAQLDTQLISDHKQSLVIPLIAKLDPTAHFVVLFRDPISSIQSFVRRKWFRRASIWECNRLRPWQGFPEDWTQPMKCTWLWCETYRVILTTIIDQSYELLETQELGKTVLNASPKSSSLKFNARESEFLETHALPLYQSLRTIRQQLGSGPVGNQIAHILSQEIDMSINEKSASVKEMKQG